MNTVKQNSEPILGPADLMRRILEVRYTDMEEEKRLCKCLLADSEAQQYRYGEAFANLYLVDSHLALGEYSQCDFYLMRASLLCKQNGFDDLMLTLCNCAGLYYQKLNDDQTALSYFLEGTKLAETLGDIGMAGKLYNNIGYSFSRNGDMQTARTYFQLAYGTVQAQLEGENIRSAVTYLSNLAEACIFLGDAEGAGQALVRCEQLSENDIYSRIRLGSSWCAYYACVGDAAHCAEIADRLMESDLVMAEDHFFVCDMAEGLCRNMLTVGDHPRARRMLQILLRKEYGTSLFLQYRIQCLKIRCLEAFEEAELLPQAYREYHDIVMKVTVIEDEIRAQSMLSNIQIHNATLERERMRQQMQDLENARQRDELTGLYNRRYFNKLLSKLAHREDVQTLGLVMLDVDYFKQYNDFYGHFQGDHALRTVARVLTACADADTYVSRYGGDEFVCLCVNRTDEAMEDYVLRTMEALRCEQVPHEAHRSSSILTISMGYCNEPFRPGMDSEELVQLADQALYAAKRTQRGTCARKRFSEHAP